MIVAAVIHADLERAALGTASRLAEPLGGTPVLARTLARLEAARRLDHVVVTCPTPQVDTLRALIPAQRATVQGFDGPPFAPHATIQVARKWALHSWRGGLGNTCFFDEHTHPALCAQIAEHTGADAVVTLAAESALVCGTVVDALVTQLENAFEADETRMVFAQAPPGLVPTVFHRGLLAQAGQAGVPIGWINAYRPDQPRADMLTTSACLRLPLSVQHTTGRLLSDTRRGFARLAALLDETDGVTDIETLCATHRTLSAASPEPWPREVQIELTTADPLAGTSMRPRGSRVPARSPMSRDLFDRVIEQIAEWDDSLVVLGGFGDPLLHPEFVDMLGTCRRAGLFGVAIRTTALTLDDRIATALVDCGVDIVQVLLDAAGPEQFATLHGVDGFAAAHAGMDRLITARRTAGRGIPNIIPSLTKAVSTLEDIEPFFDRWIQHHGWATLEGYSTHGGQLPDLRVINMAPPGRRPCRQLQSRCTVLSDGQVVLCDQDFTARHVMGDARRQDLATIWQDAPFATVRAAHRRAAFDDTVLCGACDEWQRP